MLSLRLLYRKVKDWRRSEVILSRPSRPAKWIMDNLHKLSLAVPDTPDDYLMTGAQFDEYISWPQGRPESQWGVVLLLTLMMVMMVMMVQMMLMKLGMLLRRRFLLMMMLEMCRV